MDILNKVSQTYVWYHIARITLPTPKQWRKRHRDKTLPREGYKKSLLRRLQYMMALECGVDKHATIVSLYALGLFAL